ncbi:terminase [bacterium]|nr:terminase [bacterium]NDD84705.1 terminase [bacterium]
MNDGYLGNTKLKKPNVRHQYTHDQIEDYVKCSQDEAYFVKNYVKIVHVDKGIVVFDLWPFQESFITTAKKERFVVAKMPRQVGKTTTIAALILHMILFTENYNVAILANKERQSKEILARIKLAYENLPRWMQQGIVEWNKGNIELENGSKVLASSTTSSAIRGGSFNLVYLDEFAFVPDNIQEEFFKSVYPTISSGQTTKILVTSTPNGLNMFYKLWVDSEEGRNNFKRVSVHWRDVPGRDDIWKEETIKNTSQEQFDQEFECEFLGSTNTLISAQAIRRMVFKTPIKSSEQGLRIYSDPVPNGLYTMIVDTSRGKGLDYSAFIVVDVSQVPYKTVATFRNNELPSVIYPTVVEQTAKYYNGAQVLIETNDVGQQVADILRDDLEYDNVIYTTSDSKSGQIITAGFGGVRSPGVKTSKQVKRIGCQVFKTLVESDKLIINDYHTIQEISRFALRGKSYEAEDGNDDLVMCHVLFAWMSTQPYFRELTNIDLRLKLYNDQQKILEENILPFGLINDGNKPPEELEVLELENMSFEQWMRS